MAVQSESQKKNLASFLPLVGEAYSSVGIVPPKDISEHRLFQFSNGKNKEHLLVFPDVGRAFQVHLPCSFIFVFSRLHSSVVTYIMLLLRSGKQNLEVLGPVFVFRLHFYPSFGLYSLISIEHKCN